MPHFKEERKSICRQLDGCFGLKAGLRCVFEASTQSGVYESRGPHVKRELVMKEKGL
jgi:hypothetical protein